MSGHDKDKPAPPGGDCIAHDCVASYPAREVQKNMHSWWQKSAPGPDMLNHMKARTSLLELFALAN
jgi:hypothetical protein